MLFLLIIDDVENGFRNVFYLIYADDLQIYVTFPLELQRYVLLVEAHANILKWATVNQLTLNLTKTKAIVVSLYIIVITSTFWQLYP